jgi:hypothetical protein
MSRSEQLSVAPEPLANTVGAEAEAAARQALRRQIAKLERELSQLVAEGFPDIPATCSGAHRRHGPRLLGLAELERERDALVASLGEVSGLAAARAERHRRGRELLAAMQLEPARYKFVRLRAVDVGEAGCGVWRVQPRLGLIGMLAGWWRVTLSSGCPLAKGRVRARPSLHRPASSYGRHLSRPGAARLLSVPRSAHRGRPHRGEHAHERAPLALGHRSDRLLLGHRDLR